jgi:hypothetical protein
MIRMEIVNVRIGSTTYKPGLGVHLYIIDAVDQ